MQSFYDDRGMGYAVWYFLSLAIDITVKFFLVVYVNLNEALLSTTFMSQRRKAHRTLTRRIPVQIQFGITLACDAVKIKPT